MRKSGLIVLIVLCLSSAGALLLAQNKLIRASGNTVSDRITVPEGTKRVAVSETSFGAFLRNFPLRTDGSAVYLYNGSLKNNQQVHAAVLDIDVGNRDLQQCADAVMRLRAEYLFKQGKFDEIYFNFTNGFKCAYVKWREGYRMVVNGNQTYWSKTAQPDYSYASFRKYMDLIFSYAGTLSLAREMISVPVSEMQIGDVFIQGGSPGHAVIVMDMAVDPQKKKQYFLLAQSYMPAQSIHILKNLQQTGISPWYAADFGEVLSTPEWTFTRYDLKRFKRSGL
jgi:hypothetical protein